MFGGPARAYGLKDAGKGLRLQESPVPPAQCCTAVGGGGKWVMAVGVFIVLFSPFSILEWGEVGRRNRV